MEKIEQAINNCIDSLFDSSEVHLSDKNIRFIPSKEEICKIVDDVKKVLFPKYFAGSEDVTKSELSVFLKDIALRLLKQIELSLAYEESRTKKIDCITSEISEKAGFAVAEFMSGLGEVFNALKFDITATLNGDPAAGNVDLILMTYPGIEATFTYRIAHVLHKLNVPLIPRIMTEYAHSKTGIDIHPGAVIGKSFVIDHGTGVVIGETTEIGDGVKLYQGVTLGAISLKNSSELVGKKRHPTVENNVTIYSGATVLGGKTVIGEGATIGSSAFITKSVEKGMTVAIEKPKLRLYYSDSDK